MRNWIIVLTFFSLWLSTQFSEFFQNYLAYFLILTFGVLHGANDIFIANKLGSGKKSVKSIVGPYLLVVLAVTVLFVISRPIGLLLFIGVSAYHFGEQHFNAAVIKKNSLNILLYFSYGMLILFMIFYSKFDEVKLIITDISGIETMESVYLNGLLISLVTFCILFSYLMKYGLIKINVLKEMLMLLVFAIVFKTASLSWAFAIYFIFWHSIPSLNDQMVLLYGDASRSSLLKYIRTSWLYWGISIVGLLVIYLLLRNKVDYFITVLLYILAAITFPHVIVMSKLERLKN